MVQWLGLCAFTAGGMCSIPGGGTKTLHVGELKKKKREKQKTAYFPIRSCSEVLEVSQRHTGLWGGHLMHNETPEHTSLGFLGAAGCLSAMLLGSPQATLPRYPGSLPTCKRRVVRQTSCALGLKEGIGGKERAQHGSWDRRAVTNVTRSPWSAGLQGSACGKRNSMSH